MTSPSSNGRTPSTISESSAASSNSSVVSSEEALSILLSPDGYYTYLSIPKPDPSTIGPKYLTSQQPNSADNADNAVDIDQVKKNYRRLSLKHHPDRKTGDPETFRILTRAKIVLSSPKLRREYDLVGLDLDDDAEEVAEDDEGNASSANGESEKKEQKENNGGNSKTETVMGYLASATLAGILQMVVRTGMMGLVSVLLSRYIVLVSACSSVLNCMTKSFCCDEGISYVNWRNKISILFPLLNAVIVFFDTYRHFSPSAFSASFPHEFIRRSNNHYPQIQNWICLQSKIFFRH